MLPLLFGGKEGVKFPLLELIDTVPPSLSITGVLGEIISLYFSVPVFPLEFGIMYSPEVSIAGIESVLVLVPGTEPPLLNFAGGGSMLLAISL